MRRASPIGAAFECPPGGGVSLFGGASSEVRRCGCASLMRASFLSELEWKKTGRFLCERAQRRSRNAQESGRDFRTH